MQCLTGKRSDPGPNRAVTGDIAPGSCAVNSVADQGMPTMGEMHPDLMRPTGGETAFDESGLRVERSLHTIMRDCQLSLVFADNSHLLAVGDAAADVLDNVTRGWVWQAPNECGIGAVDPAERKIATQRVMGGLGLGYDHEAARVLIKPMDDTGPANFADPGQALTTMVDQRVYEGAVRVSRRRMDNQPRWLIDDDQMCILKADIQREQLRGGRSIYRIGEDYNEVLAPAYPHRGIAQRPSFVPDIAGLDQVFEPGTRERWEIESKHTIKALAGVPGTSGDSYRDTTTGLRFVRHD